jgi:hypothetical protein
VRCQHLHVVKRLKPDDVRHPECRVRERKGARFRFQRTSKDAPWSVVCERDCWWLEDWSNKFL